MATAPQTTTVTTTQTATTTTTQIVAAGTPAPAASTQAAQQAYVSALQTLVTAATADLADPTLSRSQQAATRTVLSAAQSALQTEQQPAGPTPTLYTCTEADVFLFPIAQRFLSDPLRYTDIQALNALSFVTVLPGQQLLIPAS